MELREINDYLSKNNIEIQLNHKAYCSNFELIGRPEAKDVNLREPYSFQVFYLDQVVLDINLTGWGVFIMTFRDPDGYEIGKGYINGLQKLLNFFASDSFKVLCEQAILVTADNKNLFASALETEMLLLEI